MSWFQKLYATYEHCYGNPAFAESAYPLLPVSHISQQAHILVTLNDQGDFMRAEILEKQQTIIPATEKSAARASGPAAHPLADKLHYCAADYKGGKENQFALYEEGLAAWCASEHAHPKAQAILAYVRKKTLVHDLLQQGVLQADAKGCLLTEPPEENPSPLFKLLTPKKVDGQTVRDQGDALICWRVESPGDFTPDTWNDTSLQQAWTAYDAGRESDETLCMVSGAALVPANHHPKYIRRPGDQAKLISANDDTGFTFKGRFEAAREACSVGYAVSNKAHNALRWLIARQGYRNGEQVILAWAVKGADIPEPLDDVWLQEDGFQDIAPDPPAPSFGSEPETVRQETASAAESAQPDHTRDLGRSFAKHLRRVLKGYADRLQPTDDIVILGLDAATPGRLSVTFYRELLWSDYLRRLESWQEEFSWVLRRSLVQEVEGKKRNSVVWQISAPRPEEICFAAYGPRADGTLKSSTIERLLPCIADGAPLPRDLLESCIRRACNRAALDRWEWQTILGITCGLYKGCHSPRNPMPEERRDYSMSLDETRTSRDYLFGRLFAVAEYAERSALDAAEEKRPTNAERLMQRFVEHPESTWLTLEKQLNPYMRHLQQSNERGRSVYFRCKKLQQSICDLLQPEEATSATRLSGEFLLGYHCQMSAFYKKHASTESQPAPEGENA